MNIAVFIKRTTFHKGYGGLETQNKALCEGLLGQGHGVTVFSPSWDIRDEEIDENGIKYVFVPSDYRTLFSSKKNNWYNKSVLYFQKYHNEKPFDLVVSQSSAAYGMIKARKELGVKIVSVAHGSIISELKTRYKNIYSLKSLIRLIPDTAFGLLNFFTRQREFVHGSDKVIAVSNYVKNALIEETYAPSEKFKVIHNGIDPQDFISASKDNEENDDSGEFRILFVGQLIKEKGANILTKFFNDERFDNICLDVAGGGPEKRSLDRKIKNSKLQEKILLHGKLDLEKLLKLYTSTKTKIFIFPTNRYEGFPMVLVEAMMSGLPVIGYNLGGVNDAIEDGSTGYLIPEGDFGLFKDRLIELYNDRDKRNTMGINAYKKAMEEYTLQFMIDEYIKILDEVRGENEDS